jgi:hypothetical protein
MEVLLEQMQQDVKALQKQLLEQREEFRGQLADIQAGIAEIRVIYADHHRRLDRAEKTLFGNGSTGLCTKVSAILYLSSAIAGFVVMLLAQAISDWIH